MPYQPQSGTLTPGAPIRVTPEEAPVISAMLFAFSPLHKRAFGVATGVAGAALIAYLTLAAMFMPSDVEFPLGLLQQYFYGYSVSWTGVVIGAAWGFVVAFVAGWFTAFCRNFAVAVSSFLIRTRAELESTRDFLDHI